MTTSGTQLPDNLLITLLDSGRSRRAVTDTYGTFNVPFNYKIASVLRRRAAITRMICSANSGFC